MGKNKVKNHFDGDMEIIIDDVFECTGENRGKSGNPGGNPGTRGNPGGNPGTVYVLIGEIQGQYMY